MTDSGKIDATIPPHERGFCPVCGFHGWEGFVGEDYDDCPCCDVDFCQFTSGPDDPTEFRAAWLARNGLTATNLAQLVDNLGVTPERPDSWPPVMYAAALGRLDEATALLAAGADLHATNALGETALHCAVARNQEHLVGWLLERGADARKTETIDLRNERGDWHSEYFYWQGVLIASRSAPGPLHWAAALGNLAIVRLLIEHGADVKLRNQAGQTALFFAAAGGHPEVVDELLSGGVDVKVADEFGVTALLVAATFGQAAIVLQLLAAGATADVYDGRGEGPLTRLIESTKAPTEPLLEAVAALVAKGANVNAPSRDRDTPLYCAIVKNDIVLVRQLLALGADPRRRAGGQLFSPRQLDAMEVDPDSATAFRRLCREPAATDASCVPLLGAMFVDDDAFRALVVEELLAAGAEVDARGGYLSKTPLLAAISERHLDSAERLLKAGADPNVIDDLGMTALIWAARWSPEAVRVLLAHGADARRVGADGMTALYCARSTESVRLLVAAGAPIVELRSEDSTRLIRAVVDGDREMVACLLELGADPTRQHGTWGSAIDTARVRSDQAMLDLLRGAIRPDEPKFGGLLGK